MAGDVQLMNLPRERTQKFFHRVVVPLRRLCYRAAFGFVAVSGVGIMKNLFPSLSEDGIDQADGSLSAFTTSFASISPVSEDVGALSDASPLEGAPEDQDEVTTERQKKITTSQPPYHRHTSNKHFIAAFRTFPAARPTSNNHCPQQHSVRIATRSSNIFDHRTTRCS